MIDDRKVRRGAVVMHQLKCSGGVVVLRIVGMRHNGRFARWDIQNAYGVGPIEDAEIRIVVSSTDTIRHYRRRN